MGRYRVRFQDLEGSSDVTVCSSSLGRPLISQVTFRSFVSPGAVHSRVALHQPGVKDADLTRILGYLNTTFTAGRHTARVDKVMMLENEER